MGTSWTVFDSEGTQKAARQRAFPQIDERPPAFRRLDDVCAPGSRGRQRGEDIRTRPTVSQAQRSPWLGTFGNRGNGRDREELRKGLTAIGRDLAAHQFSPERALLRLDGHSGNGVVLSDLADFGFVTRGNDSHLLDHPRISARLHLPADQSHQRPESPRVRTLSDCPQIPVGADGRLSRVIVPTTPAGKQKSPIGVTCAGVVSELFFPNRPQQAFAACDVVAWSLPRGAFEPAIG
jgi:hypothetical protein